MPDSDPVDVAPDALEASLSRRSLVGGIASAAAALTISSPVRALDSAKANQRTERSVDVAIIGGGLAGLSAATALAEAGISSQIFEAQESLGGRIKSGMSSDGTSVELGAQFINADMALMTNAMKRHGLRTLERSVRQNGLIIVDGQKISMNDKGLASEVDWMDIRRRQGATSRKPDLSVYEAIDNMVEDPQERFLTRSNLTEMLGRTPDMASFQGTLEMMITYTSERDELEMQSRDPLRQLIEGMASALPLKPHISTPVKAVSRDGSQVTIDLADRKVSARAAIVAVPPSVSNKINLQDAGLSPRVQAALGSFIAGDMYKAIIKYDRNLMNDIGYAVIIEDGQFAFVDASDPDNSIGKIIVFCAGPTARALAGFGEADRRRKVLEAMSRALGPVALNPDGFADAVWVDHPWCGGGYNDLVQFGGVADAARVLRQQKGPIFFATSVISERFAGYMEGAMHAGIVAASSVVSHLRGS